MRIEESSRLQYETPELVTSNMADYDRSIIFWMGMIVLSGYFFWTLASP